MFERASSSLYWPNFRVDLINHTAACTSCSKYQPSNPAMPPVVPDEPSYPFQSICADFFTITPHTYLAIVDRFSGWLSVFKLERDTSEQVINVLRAYVSIFGIPVVLTSDGAKVFTSRELEAFCYKFGIIHRVSTAYHPRANKRAEVAVKSAKRLIRGNTSQTGTLHTDDLARALLQHRNTPCPVTGLSPAQIVYGRVLRDFLPLQPGKFLPREEWRLAAQQREVAYSRRRMSKQEQLSQGAKQLPPLQPGHHVRVQDQHKTGNSARLWTQTGVVLEAHPDDAYLISINGSRTVTKRNRQFLRQYTPLETDYTRPSPTIKRAQPLGPPTVPAHTQHRPAASPPTAPAPSSQCAAPPLAHPAPATSLTIPPQVLTPHEPATALAPAPGQPDMTATSQPNQSVTTRQPTQLVHLSMPTPHMADHDYCSMGQAAALYHPHQPSTMFSPMSANTVYAPMPANTVYAPNTGYAPNTVYAPMPANMYTPAYPIPTYTTRHYQ